MRQCSLQGLHTNALAVSSIVQAYYRDSRLTMETLEFIIYPDGRVEEKVTGIVGASCAEVTAAIEAQLGIVLTHETTSEYFASIVQHSADVANTQTTYSDW